jgi:dihydrolipoamide dehydrogenase
MIEFLPSFGGIGIGINIDAKVSKTSLRILTKQGLKFKMSTKVMGVETPADGSIKVNVESFKIPGKKEVLDCDILLVCIGRRTYMQNLGLKGVWHGVSKGVIRWP